MFYSFVFVEGLGGLRLYWDGKPNLLGRKTNWLELGGKANVSQVNARGFHRHVLNANLKLVENWCYKQ